MSDSFSGESFLFTQDSIRFPFSSGTFLTGLGVVMDFDVIFRDFFWFTLFVLGVLKLTCGGRGEGGGGICISSVFFSLAHLTINVDTRGVISDLSSMRHDEVLASWYVLISLFGTVSCFIGRWGRELDLSMVGDVTGIDCSSCFELSFFVWLIR